MAFDRTHPGIDFKLCVGNTADVAAAVLHGSAELDFGEREIDEPMLRSRVVARDQLVIVVGPEHPWANGEPLSPARLVDSDWVLREPGSGTRSVLKAALTLTAANWTTEVDKMRSPYKAPVPDEAVSQIVAYLAALPVAK